MRKIRLIFSKTEAAAYLSHLDVMRTFARSFVRAGIQLRHTEGFNPHPYLSIAHPLPVGFSGHCELLDCEVLTDDIDTVPDKLNSALPQGFKVISLADAVKPIADIAFAEYLMVYCYDGNMPDDAAVRLNEHFSAPEIFVDKKSKKGIVAVNLVDYFESIEFSQSSDHEISGRVVLKIKEAPLNPRYFTQSITDDELRPDFTKYSRIEYFDS